MLQITVANNAGGVGKTTCVLGLADALQVLGLRVLVIDPDPQGVEHRWPRPRRHLARPA